MNKNFLRRARIAGRAFLDLSNWREVLPPARVGKPVTEIRLRSGWVLAAPPRANLWTHFSDVWYHKSYTKFCALPPNSTVVDIGANVGVFALFAARKANVVYAIEPASSNYSTLISNVIQAKNIIPLQFACLARDGDGTLDVSGSPATFSLFSTSSDATAESVSVVSLATFFKQHRIDRCDYLKLDCEGAEFEIILETDPSILNRVTRVVMEYHDHLSKNYTHLDILEKLRTLGYQARPYNQSGPCGMIAAIRPDH